MEEPLSNRYCPEVLLAWLVAATAGLTACGTKEAARAHPPDAGDASARTDGAAGAPRYSMALSASDSTLVVKRGADVLFRLPADGLELGRVAKVSDATSYDPTSFAGKPSAAPSDLVWLPVQTTEVGTASATHMTATLTYAADLVATLDVSEGAPGRFDATLVPTTGADSVAYYRIRARTDAKEGFYGLGEAFDAVNNRGKVRAMQLEADGATESNYNDAHVPVPFVTGTRGWGLFVESRYPMAFDVASQEDDLVEVTVGTGLASAKGLAFHVFAAGHPLDVTKHYYDLTGYPVKPARWALGPIVWRDENTNQAQVESDIHILRDQDLATTAIWIDRPYATAENTFDFDPQRYTDPKAMIRLAHDLGLRVSLWHVPYLDEKTTKGIPATQALRDEATAKGYYPQKTGLLLFNSWGRPIDLTNKAAYSWWQGLIHRYTDLGIEGFKLDYAEDIVVGLGATRNVWQFSDGSDERTMHASFQALYHAVYAETLPSTGGFLLCRAGTYGDQTHASVIWPGDLDASFAKRGEAATDTAGKPYSSVGGLPASVIAGLSLGPSGFPMYGADTGGYRHSPPDQETFMRWFEQTALSTVMQIGTSSDTVAWELAKNHFDQSELDAYRNYTRLHLRLFPYEWTYVERLQKDGRPIARALGLAYPELAEHPDDTYLFGDDLLVAPVLARGVKARDVSFPPGTWLDWWSGAQHDGGKHATVAAPVDTLPLFVRAGAIIPMLRPTIDSTSPTSRPDLVDSYATTPGVIYARVAAGPKSGFVLFDGATLSQEMSATGLTLGSTDGAEFKQGVVFEVIAWSRKPASVTEGASPLIEKVDLAGLEAADSGWAFDGGATGGTLYVKVAAGSHTVVVKP
jgi:alpha-D-xyloside xylohydrolase